MIINRKCIKKIDQLIDFYIKVEVKREFLHEDFEYEKNLDELVFLLESAMILANSQNDKNKERALKISTIIANIPLEENSIQSFSSVILGRLRNFQCKELLDKKAIPNIVGPIDMLKNNLYKQSNTVKLSDKEYLLNDFQMKFYRLVEKKLRVSISAPTSVGKSFIIKRIIIDILIKGKQTCAYIVPTRALISEVMSEFREEVHNQGLGEKFNISSSSDVVKLDKNLKTILVLTQERFYQLCNNKEIDIDILVVDEAQNVMDGKRGILLEYSIKYAKKLWSNLKMIFISPIINNPEEFTQKFLLKDDTGCLNEPKSSVRQNIIKLYKDNIGYKVSINSEIITKNLRIRKSGSTSEKIANVVIKFGNGQNSIIYCNTPKIAVSVCEKIYNLSDFEDVPELNEFADFIEYSISNKYLLGKYIRKGIVYHYGNLPPFIRSGIEELAAKGYFRIIACTSTLLQGVNLPAQNIYIYNPIKGTGKKKINLSNLEFWNLVGRAGRMGHDFCGNIILIQNNEWEDIDKYNDKNNRVEFISHKYKDTKHLKNMILESIGQEGSEKGVTNDDGFNDYIVSSTIIDRINDEELTMNKEINQEYKELEKLIDGIIEKFEPPQDLLIKLVGIKHSNINRLWKLFKENNDQIQKSLLIHPLSIDKKTFLDGYNNIIEIINEYILNGKLYDEFSKEKLKYMSYEWIMEKKLKNILLYNIKKKPDEFSTDKKISAKIESEVKFLNKDIRYRLVEGFYAYEEILKEFLIETKQEDLAKKMVNMAMYLEIGACKNVTIELISLGMNREFAIEVEERFKFTENNCLEELKKIDYSKLEDGYLKTKLVEFIEKLK